MLVNRVVELQPCVRSDETRVGASGQSLASFPSAFYLII